MVGNYGELWFHYGSLMQGLVLLNYGSIRFNSCQEMGVDVELGGLQVQGRSAWLVCSYVEEFAEEILWFIDYII